MDRSADWESVETYSRAMAGCRQDSSGLITPPQTTREAVCPRRLAHAAKPTQQAPLKLALRRVVASSCRNALVQHTPAMNSLPPLAPSFGKQDPTPMPHVNKRQARVLRIRRPAGRTRRASAPSSLALLPPVQPPHAPRLHFAGPGDLLEWGSAGGYADDEGREGHEGFDDDLGVGRGNG